MAPTRVVPTLVTIPAEIRNAIFSHLLPSPSDRLTMERDNLSVQSKPHALIYHEKKGIKNQRISIALLRTCKQFHKECKGLLDWTQYSFVFDCFHLARCVDESRHFPTSTFKHIRDIELQYDPYEDGHRGVECLGLLARCVEQDSLKDFTITTIYKDYINLYGDGTI